MERPSSEAWTELAGLPFGTKRAKTARNMIEKCIFGNPFRSQIFVESA